jgi:hypothetical protein
MQNLSNYLGVVVLYDLSSAGDIKKIDSCLAEADKISIM